MLDRELSVLEAIARHGDEASLAEIQAELPSTSDRQLRSRLSLLSQQGLVIRQRLVGCYSLTHQGKEHLLNELAVSQPDSPILQRERQRKQVILQVEIESLEDGRYLASCAQIAGCHAEGDTVGEALENLEDVAVLLLRLEHQRGLPKPRDLKEFKPSKLPLQAQLVVPLPK